MSFPPRMASHVPTIKCSHCERDIDISSAENHTCSERPAVNPPLPRPSPIPNSNAESLATPLDNPSLLRPQRPTLPKIDSSVTIPGPFAGELTPASSGNGSVGSPVSATSRRPPWKAPRKTALATTQRPPSPELSNLDCAFPPFPMSSSKAAKTDKSSKHPNKSKSSKSRPQSPASSRRSSKYVPSFRSHSRTLSISSGRQRSKSVAGDDYSARPSTAPREIRPSFANPAGVKKPSTDDIPPLPNPSPNRIAPSLDRAEAAPGSLAISNTDTIAPKPGLHRFATADDIGNFSIPTDTVSPKREPSYKSKRPPPIVSNIPLVADDRPSLAKTRSPTVPPPTSAASLGRSLTKMFGRRRSQSVSAKRDVVRAALSDEPNQIPTPPISLSAFDAHRQVPFTLDTTSAPNSAPIQFEQPMVERVRPLDLEQSTGEVSERKNSPKMLECEPITQDQAEAAGTRHPEPAETMHFDFAWNQTSKSSPAQATPTSIAERPTDLKRASIDSASSYGSVSFTERTASSRSSPPPTDELARKVSEGVRLGVVEPVLAEMPAPLRPRNPEVVADSPTDPLFVDGRLSPIPAPAGLDDEQIQQATDPDNEPKAPITPHAPRKESLAGQGRTLGPHKGICRGCSKPILPQQKSVSSADGRLTGRYHKECFVCWTCKDPFPSAEIYVHADHPYCAHHYHELENSLCATCTKGIEGLYMETANVAGRGREKHHPHCLKCTTCRVQLNTDYFELSGNVYCERDAFRLASMPRVHDRSPARPSPLVREYISSGNPELLKGKNFPERRITRLMTT